MDGAAADSWSYLAGVVDLSSWCSVVSVVCVVSSVRSVVCVVVVCVVCSTGVVSRVLLNM